MRSKDQSIDNPSTVFRIKRVEKTMKKMIENSRRLTSAMFLLVLAALTGCASTTSIDPARTSMMVAHAVSPGPDSMTTSEALRCRFKNGPVSKEAAAKYLEDPSQAVKDGLCDFAPQKDVVQGSPSLGGQLVLGAANAVIGGVVNFGVQSRLQYMQQKYCDANGGCSAKTMIQNVNNTTSAAESLAQQTANTQASTQVIVGPVAPACQAANNCGK